MQGIDERRELAERLRDYFEVQLLFAERLAEATPLPLPDACLRFTNLHRRFGLGRADGASMTPAWARYAAGLERRQSGRDRLDWTVTFFAEAPPEADAAPRFGCFKYDPPTREGVVRIHFSNRDSSDEHGPLARAKAERRVAELREMFGHIRSHHPDTRSVLGASWLYNLDAYRRLFPPEYGDSRFEPDRVRLDGTSSWGQLLDFRGCVKPAVRRALLDNLERLDVAAPWRAFPFRALGAVGEIDQFYRFYGS